MNLSINTDDLIVSRKRIYRLLKQKHGVIYIVGYILLMVAIIPMAIMQVIPYRKAQTHAAINLEYNSIYFSDYWVTVQDNGVRSTGFFWAWLSRIVDIHFPSVNGTLVVPNYWNDFMNLYEGTILLMQWTRQTTDVPCNRNQDRCYGWPYYVPSVTPFLEIVSLVLNDLKNAVEPWELDKGRIPGVHYLIFPGSLLQNTRAQKRLSQLEKTAWINDNTSVVYVVTFFDNMISNSVQCKYRNLILILQGMLIGTVITDH